MCQGAPVRAERPGRCWVVLSSRSPHATAPMAMADGRARGGGAMVGRDGDGVLIALELRATVAGPTVPAIVWLVLLPLAALPTSPLVTSLASPPATLSPLLPVTSLGTPPPALPSNAAATRMTSTAVDTVLPRRSSGAATVARVVTEGAGSAGTRDRDLRLLPVAPSQLAAGLAEAGAAVAAAA